MEHLTDITVDDLQQALESTNGKTPVLWLVAAIAYKNGITQSDLAEWFDVKRKTIYNWLTRLEERDLYETILDEHHARRPRKFTEEQLVALESVLQNPPVEVGFDAPDWSTKLLQEFILNQFEIDYSRPSCRRLMKEAGLSYQTPRKAAVGADPEDRDAFEQE